MDIREKSSNEKRLIDANKLIDFIDVGHLRNPGDLCYSEVDVANLLLRAPTIEAVPVRHGRWEPGNPICPVCGGNKFKDLDADIWCDWMPDFCPNCGAKMDGGGE